MGTSMLRRVSELDVQSFIFASQVSSPGQTLTVMRCATATLRAYCSRASTSLFADWVRLLLMNWVKLGIAMAAKTPNRVTMIINSIKVKPLARLFWRGRATRGLLSLA